MAKRAVDGIQQLIERTGGPRVKATVTVDQVYAQDQHENLTYVHTGGEAKFLENPLIQDHPRWLEDFAARLLNARRSAATLWGDTVGKPLIKEVARRAPKEFGDLGESAGLVVHEGGAVVMDIPPIQGRLSRPELDAKDDLRTDDHERGGL